MKKALCAAVLLALVAVFSQVVLAQSNMPLVTSVIQSSGTVKITAVDNNKRTVTLQAPNGDTQTYTVSKDVMNLNQVKPGDILTAAETDKLAVYAEKGGSSPTAYEVFTLESAPQGSKPGFVATDTLTVIGTVQSIDYNKRTMTVKGPSSTQTFQVSADVPNLNQIKKGDSIVAQYTETITMYVQPPTQ